jgi:alpha-N-acetylglucosaminidase
MLSRLASVLVVLLAAAACASAAPPETHTRVRALIHRYLPLYEQRIVLEDIPPSDGQDVFELETRDGKLVLRGNSGVAMAAGFNWYLKYYCLMHVSCCGQQLNQPAEFPVVPLKERHTSWARHRYYLNYCTHSYTAAFWDWDRWAREIDWMALNGITMPLAVTGQEAVWQRTLRRFGFSDAEIRDFIPGPAFTAWWLMGNLEGWGGPVSQRWIDDRAELQRKIVARMREYGMTPVLAAFYGMVPSKLREKFPSARIFDSGLWCGFRRPAVLDPSDPLFARMAAVFYEEQKALYGDALYYAGDPFHEGAVVKQIDVGRGAAAIRDAMRRHEPHAVWVLQGWQDNPVDALLKALAPGDAIVLDLYADARPQWSQRPQGFRGQEWLWCILPNFGGRSGVFGRLDRMGPDLEKARHDPLGRQLGGIGALMEGSESNPVAYDLLYELPWHDSAPTLRDWIRRFADRRYGAAVREAEDAWALLAATVYACPKAQDGAPESVFCARPSINVEHASTWGATALYYLPSDLERAARLLLRCSSRLRASDAYQYDIAELTSQVLANRGLALYRQMMAEDPQTPRFARDANLFLQLMRDQDRLLGTRREFLLGTWLDRAQARAGNDEAERRLFPKNARLQITTWGSRAVADDGLLHDYANKEWSGLIRDFYLPRWSAFFDALSQRKPGEPLPHLDYYALEEAWVNGAQTYSAEPQGDAVALAAEVLR